MYFIILILQKTKRETECDFILISYYWIHNVTHTMSSRLYFNLDKISWSAKIICSSVLKQPS